MPDGEATYCVEHLTVWSWVRSVLPHLVRDRLAGTWTRARCFVIDASPSGLVLAGRTAAALGCRIEWLKFRMVDIRDEKGRLLRLRIAYDDIARVQAEARREVPFARLVDMLGQSDSLVTYVGKNIAAMYYIDRWTMYRALLLVHVVALRLGESCTDGRRPVLFLERRPWFRAITNYAARHGVEVLAQVPALDARRFADQLLGPRGVAALRGFRDRWNARRIPTTSGSRRWVTRLTPVGDSKNPRLAVQYYGHLNLEQPELHSDLFFWQQSDLSGGDIVLFFEFPADPADDAKAAQLARHGISAIATDPRATRTAEVPVLLPPFFLGSDRRGPAIVGGADARWMRRQIESYQVLRDYWRDLFARAGVRLYVGWYRFDARHQAIGAALRELDGISIIYQRAYQADPSPEIAVNADIMFGYSPLDALVERRSSSVIPYHVAVGYFGDHRFSLLRPQAEVVRGTLQAWGARFIVAYFDENSGDDPRWHTGHEFMRENYTFLLERLLEERDLGLVLKPKRPASLRRRLGQVAELLERALATGRCFMYEGGPVHGHYPPVAAALTADAAIHGHLCAGSAGVEAALAGVPTLLLDREGWPESPLYRLGLGRAVFTDWDSLWAVIRDIRERGEVDGRYGDWGPLLDEIDPFRDGRAAERMGTYLQWLIEGFKAGLDRERVMAAAAERYAARWGADKITTVTGPWSAPEETTRADEAREGGPAPQVRAR